MITSDMLSAPAREAIAQAVHKVVCKVTNSSGDYHCKYYSAIGSNVLAIVTGRPYRAVGGRSWVVDAPASPQPLVVTMASGQPLFQSDAVPAQLAHVRPPDGIWRHAWIGLDGHDDVVVDLSIRPALWAWGGLPPGREKVRETRFDELMAGFQYAFKRESLQALFLALPAIVADLDYDGLKRLLERLPQDERLVRRAYAYWKAAQPA